MRVFGIAGWSGSGKTTLIERVVPCLMRRGLTVSVIKHAHHGFDLDRPGKDSYRQREAGAIEVLVTSGERWALMHELRGAPEPTLAESVGRMTPCDIVLVEGYKTVPIPKLEVWRAATGKPQIFPGDPAIVAVASDSLDCLPPGTAPDREIALLSLADTEAITTFIERNARIWAPSIDSGN